MVFELPVCNLLSVEAFSNKLSPWLGSEFINKDDFETSSEIRTELAFAGVGTTAFNKTIQINDARISISIFDLSENMMPPMCGLATKKMSLVGLE